MDCNGQGDRSIPPLDPEAPPPDPEARPERSSPRSDAGCSAFRRGAGLSDPAPGGPEWLHREGCAGCRAVEASYRRLDALLRSEPRPAAPPEVLAAVLAAIGGRGARAATVRWTRRRVGSLAAVAAALALAAGLLQLPGLDGFELAPEVDRGLQQLARLRSNLASPPLGEMWAGALDDARSAAGVVQPDPAPGGLPWLVALLIPAALFLLNLPLCKGFRDPGRAAIADPPEARP